MGSRLFRQYVEPLVADYRRQLLRRNRRARSSPYSRTPSPIDTPSNDSSTNPPSTPPSNVEIIPEQQSEPPSPPGSPPALVYVTPEPRSENPSPPESPSPYDTAIDEEPGSSPRTPIDVDQLVTHVITTMGDDRSPPDVTTIIDVRDTLAPTDRPPSPRCFYCRGRNVHLLGQCVRREPISDDSLALGMGRNRRRPQ
jgi:hypothetical protein